MTDASMLITLERQEPVGWMLTHKISRKMNSGNSWRYAQRYMQSLDVLCSVGASCEGTVLLNWGCIKGRLDVADARTRSDRETALATIITCRRHGSADIGRLEVGAAERVSAVALGAATGS